ncbi:hypothetical protein K503DRAFT_569734 [Rhizopogon vinicolor AM-OR11-026]|uniref:Protein kinase domain-containing protein n=1 Tax=Rhizopogon vinicolor AM-OR11-026 TaxID=1314800 RepID=A0A1B7N7M6_9AGAM|nr:hypothetical protein K503DRAFT_569734 [Rhizopogon vinicolor AM-OR11-026]
MASNIFTRRMSSTVTFIPYVQTYLWNPHLTDFGLATIVGDAELQRTTTTVGHNPDCRRRAPEVIGVDCDPGRPTFKSDIYSFGGIMFFMRSIPSVYSSISKLSLFRSPRGMYRGKRRSHAKSALSCREEPHLRVPRITLTITGT